MYSYIPTIYNYLNSTNQNTPNISLLHIEPNIDAIYVDTLSLSKLDILRIRANMLEDKVIEGIIQTLFICKPIIIIEILTLCRLNFILLFLKKIGYTHQSFINSNDYVFFPTNVEKRKLYFSITQMTISENINEDSDDHSTNTQEQSLEKSNHIVS
jgi:hypothetical protein